MLPKRYETGWGSPIRQPGFMPGIHVFAIKQGVDGRDKPGHDSS
jgi:hypothetical protein